MTATEGSSHDLGGRRWQDDITGLPDRDALERHLAVVTSDVSLLVLEVDHFAALDAALGPVASNQLLGQLAERLRVAAPRGAYLARTGSGAFSIVSGGEHAADAGALALADRLLDVVTEPFDVGGRPVRVSACVGIALPLDGESGVALLVDDLHRRADLALAEAKVGARRTAVWEPTLWARSAQRLEEQQALRAALARPDGLTAHYQPIVDVLTRELTAVECLVRRIGQEPETGAGALLTSASDTGLLAALDRRMLALAQADLATLFGDGEFGELRVHVNVSADGLADPGWLDSVGEATPDDGARMCIEVTEHALVATGSAGARHLEEIRAQGHFVALDDFGAGYTSLATLASIPADLIKLDRSLLFDVDVDPRRRAVLAGALALARDLGLTAVAEGVETEAQHEVLVDLGCDEAQGWLHGRPRPLESLPDQRSG